MGYGKRTELAEYRCQRRGGKGLIDIKTSDRNGAVVAVAKVNDQDEVMITTTGGILIRMRVADMRPIGRNTQGVRLIRLDEGDTVSSLAKIPEDANDDLEGLPEPTGPSEETPGAHSAHILDDGVASAEASDHIDDADTTSHKEPD
jgi:DNA gyrase subunit A